MTDELCIVQFPHAGTEHGPDADDRTRKRWEKASAVHRRKFMRSAGSWRNAPEAASQAGELVFWGEWEADSTVAAAPDPPDDSHPWFVHTPFFEGIENAPGEGIPQNTDPFVFGDRFLYTFCRQPTNTRLRQLASGSLILFGSRKGRAENYRFVLDTVFVVAGSVDHRRADYLETAAPHVDALFRATTLDPMYEYEDITRGRLYFAATADAPFEGMFSFVPCLPAASGRTFARPTIKLGDAVKPTLAQQARTTPVLHVRAVQTAWHTVIDEVRADGLQLGTQVALPGPRPMPRPKLA